uniref:uncharacterized protein n=1 Tax=Semicossyphus pulcher TaxID=241346 RepID=UPI0037E839A8
MSAASCLLSEEQFLCSICLDVFTDPVTIPCGHNFCKTCITHHWDVNDRCECPICKKIFDRRPELHVNTFISEMAAQFRKSARKKTSSCSVRSRSTSGEVLCDVCTETKVKALKSCLMCLTSYCETHLEPHHRIPGLKRHELIDPVETLEDRVCKSHDRPLELFCKTDQKCVCQFCTESDHKLHCIVTLREQYEGRKAELRETKVEIQTMIQERRLKIEEMEQSVKLSRDDADAEKSDSVQVFRSLIQTVERELAELLDFIDEKQKQTEKQAEGFIKELQEEISELMKRGAEVEQLSHTEDHLQFLQSLPSLNPAPPTKDWTEVRVHSSYHGTVRRAVAQLEETLSKEMKKLCMDAELKRVQQYAVDVTLDPDTASPKLILSDDRKQVKYGDAKQVLPVHPKRFSTCACVLGKEGFSAGRFYDEVQVGEKTKWEVGVARESISRKGSITISPKNGFWAVWLRDGSEYRASAGPSVLLSLKSKPQKVGVFVDYEDGLVSFYDVDAAAHIYSFIGCNFTGKLFPFFRPCDLNNGKNSAPLIVSAVSVTDLDKMSAASCLLSEEQFRCSICLDVFTDPVTIPCGHNFCKTCITHHWDVNDPCECPLCKNVLNPRPELCVNTFISEMAAQVRQSAAKKARWSSVRSRSTSGDVLCDVCTETKAKALKSCLMCLTSYCETHLELHQKITGLTKHELIDPVENLEDRMCKSHDRPLELFCKTDQMCVCVSCTESNHKLHRIVPLMEEYEGQKSELAETEAEIQTMIQERRLKIQEMEQSVKLSRDDADAEKSDSVQVFRSLIQTVERELAELLDFIDEKQKQKEKQAEGFIKELQEEISELMKRGAEVEQFSHTEDHLQFLQSFPSLNPAPPTKDWTEVRVHSSYEGTVRRAVAQLEETFSKEMEKQLKSELKRVQQYAVDVTLDPDTANPSLILSDDCKNVCIGERKKKNLPNNPERFSFHDYVLGKKGFSGGKFYYEVEVKRKTKWEIGVAKESIKRKQSITPSPQTGLWALMLRNGSDFTTSADPSVLPSLKSKPQKVGVFVDYEEGLVSFYDANTAALIYSFTGCDFTEKLFPILCPCIRDNSAPLSITT